MNLSDTVIIETLIEINDAALVERCDYRCAMAFAIGCMTYEQRVVFQEQHLDKLIELDYGDGLVVVRLGELLIAHKYVKDVLSEENVAILKEQFQYNIGILGHKDED